MRNTDWRVACTRRAFPPQGPACPSARMHRRLKFTMAGHWIFPSFAIGPPKPVRTWPFRHGAPDHVEWLMPSPLPSRPSLSQRSSYIEPSCQTIDLSLFQYRDISCRTVCASLVSPGPFTTAKLSSRHHDAPDHAAGQPSMFNINEHCGAFKCVGGIA
jgi:hypothetical protein